MKKMNKSIKFLTMAFSIALVSVLISCTEDDNPIIIDEDPVVADGFYVIGTSTSEEISADVELQPYSVDQADGVPTMREGFYGNFYYLAAGSFNFVFYSNNIPVTYGGALEDVLYNNDEFSYSKGSLTEDGAAVAITTAGFYQIHIDLSTSLFFVSEVAYFEVIGDVTPGGWGSGTELAMKSGASADQVVFEGTNITLRPGVDGYKFRYNSNWTNNVDADGENIALQTNVGVDGFAGGANTAFTGTEGVYTVTLTFTPGSIDWTLDRTGDAVAITYDPTEHPWSLRGTAVGSPEDWGSGPLLTPNHDGTVTYRWYGVIEITAGEFKVADGGVWMGVGAATDNSGKLTGTDNFVIAEADAGFYYIVVTTADDGSTYEATIDKASFGLIGSATASTTGGDGWAADADMTESGSSFTISTALDAGEIKFRANDAWEYNLGGDLAGLTHNGANLAVDAGTYTITLTTANRGETYSATIQ
jgi:hypothetical protein